MIYLPTLTALRYENEEPKLFKSLVGVRGYPLLSKGDIIIIPSITAHLLRKNKDFTVVDLNDLIGVDVVISAPADEGTQEDTKAPADEGTQEDTKAPESDVNPEGDKAPEDDVNPPADSADKKRTRRNGK